VKEAWFLSPLRSETQASFHVSYQKNRWYDFGLGKGRNYLDLIIELKKCSITEALEGQKSVVKRGFSKVSTRVSIKRKTLI